jgi:hypothetical protein
MSESRLVWLKLGAALVAFAAGIGAVVTAVALAHSTPSAGSSTSGPQAAAATPAGPAVTETRFPTPPAGALVLAREDRDLAVGLAVFRRGSQLGLQASVLGQEAPAQGLDVSFRVPGRTPLAAEPCGPGCYRTEVPSTPAPRAVTVALQGKGRKPSELAFQLPASLPAPAAGALVSKAEWTWHGLHTLVVHDHLSSGPGTGISTLWQFAAPNRQTYAIRNGPQAVVIGARRWDRLPGHAWQASQQDPIPSPVPLWEAVSDAHVLGPATVRGRPVWKVTFFDPQIKAWFTIWVDRRTARTLELRMTAQAHFMHQVYGPFDAPVKIVPPRKAAA